MGKISLIILLLIATTSTAAVTGDPLDSNDKTTEVNGFFADSFCNDAIRYPHCAPCWSSCIYGIMMDAAYDDQWDDKW